MSIITLDLISSIHGLLVTHTQPTPISRQFVTDPIIAVDLKHAGTSAQANEHANRSNAMFRITVESSSPNFKGVLNLGTLVGSECEKNRSAEGDRHFEVPMINKSFFGLQS
jgi:stress-induced morphogen